MTTTRQLKLGAVLTGVGGPGSHGVWKNPTIPADASVNIAWYIEQAQAAERAKFDHVFIVDSQFITADSPPHYLNRLEPLTLLSALAVATTHIGLVGTLSTSYHHPFSVARQFASLDLISGGRAGWNVVTSGDEGTAGNFGLTEHFAHHERYARALEHVRVVKALWDSYEDDAFPADVERGVFLDADKLHALDHVGTYYSVTGPLNLSRSRQGQPVIFQAGDSEDGRDLGGAIADAIFTHQASIASGVAFRDDLRARALAAGRDPEALLIIPGTSIIVGDTDDDARAIEASFHAEDADFEKSLSQFGRTFGWHDFRQYDLDAPFPDLGAIGDRSFKSSADRIKQVAHEQGLTLRQTVELFTTPRPGVFVGSADTVANLIIEWFKAGAFDGINVHIRTPNQFARFTNEVLPILRARGVFRTEYESDTLRGNLGLPIPENRYTLARHASSAAA